MKRLVEFITRYPKSVIAISLLIIGILAAPLGRLAIDPDMLSLIDEDDPDLVRMDEIDDIFGGQDIAIISIAAENVFQPRVLRIVDTLTSAVESMEYVDRVTSLTNVEIIRGTDDFMSVDPFLESIPATPGQQDSLARKAKEENLIQNILISEDQTHTAILLFLSEGGHDEELYDELKSRTDRYQSEDLTIELGGMPIIRYHISADIEHDVVTFIPLGMSLMVILLFFSFRSWRGVLLPMGVVAMSIAATLGLMAWLDISLKIVTNIVPVMLIAIANAYGIHILARYYEDVRELGEAAPIHDIIYRGIKHISTPILLAGFTTIAGFLSLLSHVLPASREVGVLSAFGIALSFILSITFIPAVLTLLRRPSASENIHNDESRYISRALSHLGDAVYHHQKLTLALFIGLTIVAAFGIPLIIVDSNPLNYYEKGSEIHRISTVINENYGGASSMSVIVEGDIRDPGVLKQIDAIQSYLDTIPDIGYTMSLVDFIKEMNVAMHNNDGAYYRIPESRELVAQFLLLYSFESSEGTLDTYVDYDYYQAQVVIRISTFDVDRMVDIEKQLNRFLDENIRVDNQPQAEGYAVLIAHLIPMMVNGQIRSLFVSLFFVAVIVGIFFRSGMAALLSVLPLTTGVVSVFGLMGYFDVYLNAGTSMLSSIVVGVGIDYTIHFLYRFRLEIRQGASDLDALHTTLRTTGQGILFNAMAVMVGFSVNMLSNFLPIYFFGWLILVSILVCTIGAMTLLPGLLMQLRPKFVYGD
ncbi:MAG: MMPL family transporter, partial [Candidatus Marinimicrobia bacterium]|nr:MMPL family transporter [Candidatus Neomarinimicrobiota bacterium]